MILKLKNNTPIRLSPSSLSFKVMDNPDLSRPERSKVKSEDFMDTKLDKVLNVMESKLHRDKPVISCPESKRLKSESSSKLFGGYAFPNKDIVLNDPSLRGPFIKMLKDPSYKMMIQHQFWDDIYRIADVLKQDPSPRGCYKPIPDEIVAGGHAVFVRYVASKEFLLRFIEASKLAAKGKNTSSADIVFYTTSSGDVEGLKKALECGADIKKVDKLGRTALHIACVKGMPKCVKVLVEYGFDVGALDDNYNTPLHIAAFLGKEKCVNFLLKCGADVTLENNIGFTPLSWLSSETTPM